MTIAVRQFIPQYRLWQSGKCSIFRGRLIAAPTVYDDTFTELPAKSEFDGQQERYRAQSGYGTNIAVPGTH